jgi:response regulator RpfG family c-di-GMP phosphodiesterase
MQRLGRGGVAMIVADFELADQNGALFLAEVHQKHPAVKRILLSGVPDSPAIGQALKQKDAEALIQKPWDQSQFLAAVRGLLGQE